MNNQTEGEAFVHLLNNLINSIDSFMDELGWDDKRKEVFWKMYRKAWAAPEGTFNTALWEEYKTAYDVAEKRWDECDDEDEETKEALHSIYIYAYVTMTDYGRRFPEEVRNTAKF